MLHFSHSVQLDVSAGWRGRRESDSQKFCRPNSVHVCGVTEKNIASLVSRPHHHHHHLAWHHGRFTQKDSFELGSGMSRLVLLVAMHLALCSLR